MALTRVGAGRNLTFIIYSSAACLEQNLFIVVIYQMKELFNYYFIAHLLTKWHILIYTFALV